MKKIKMLYPAWLLACIGLVYFTVSSDRETSLFRGISDTREVLVNTENPVEITSVHVVPGQAIDKGELLVELRRPELVIKINSISHQIKELQMQQQVKEYDITAQRIRLRSERESVASDITYKIKQLQSRQELNRKLAANLKSIQPAVFDSTGGQAAGFPSIEIEALEKERELALDSIDLRMKILDDTLESIGKPMAVHIQSLKKELALLNQEQKELSIYSDFQGVIGAVYFKPGEKVSPFVPILTLHTRAPSYVKGFIPEDAYNKVALGQKVNVRSLTSRNNTTVGEVVGVGSRIVEYPVRLRVRPELAAWGREVQIKIAEDNTLLLGEKVLISAGGPETPSLLAHIGSLVNEAYGMEY